LNPSHPKTDPAAQFLRSGKAAAAGTPPPKYVQDPIRPVSDFKRGRNVLNAQKLEHI